MKSIISLLFVITLSAQPFFVFAEQKGPSSLKTEKIKGSVKNIKEKSYVIVDTNRLLNITIRKFDKEGYVRETDFYTAGGQLARQIGHVYNTDRYLVQEVDSNSNTKVSINVYEVNADGDNTKATTYASGGKLVSGIIKKYNKSHNLIERREYDDNRALVAKSTFAYDRKGNLTEVTNYSNDTVSTGKMLYKYDKAGNKTETSTLDAAGKLKNKYTYKYTDTDKKGNWLKVTRFEGDKAQLFVVREIEYYD